MINSSLRQFAELSIVRGIKDTGVAKNHQQRQQSQQQLQGPLQHHQQQHQQYLQHQLRKLELTPWWVYYFKDNNLRKINR